MSHVATGPLSQYNSLADNHLDGYFSNTRMRKHLKKAGLVSRRGEIVSENTYRLNMSRKEHKKHVKDMLAQAIVHKTLDLERQRQSEIRKKLEEIAKIELVRRVRSSRESKREASVLPFISPRPQSRSSVSGRRPKSAPARKGRRPMSAMSDQFDDDDDDEVVYLDDEGRPITPAHVDESDMRYSSKDPIDTRHLYALDTAALRKYAMLMAKLEQGKGANSPYLMNQIPLPPKSPNSGRTPRSAHRYRSAENFNKSQSPKRPSTANQAYLHPPAQPKRFPGQQESLCEVNMRYHGSSLTLAREQFDKRQDVTVEQQHCGGNTLIVFRDKLDKDTDFSFVSYRHRGFPFSLTIYIDGKMDSRVSTCCEYRHAKGGKMGGKQGHFSVINIANAVPCYKCQVEKGVRVRAPAPRRKLKRPPQEEVTVVERAATPQRELEEPKPQDNDEEIIIPLDDDKSDTYDDDFDASSESESEPSPRDEGALGMFMPKDARAVEKTVGRVDIHDQSSSEDESDGEYKPLYKRRDSHSSSDNETPRKSVHYTAIAAETPENDKPSEKPQVVKEAEVSRAVSPSPIPTFEIKETEEEKQEDREVKQAELSEEENQMTNVSKEEPEVKEVNVKEEEKEEVSKSEDKSRSTRRGSLSSISSSSSSGSSNSSGTYKLNERKQKEKEKEEDQNVKKEAVVVPSVAVTEPEDPPMEEETFAEVEVEDKKVVYQPKGCAPEPVKPILRVEISSPSPQSADLSSPSSSSVVSSSSSCGSAILDDKGPNTVNDPTTVTLAVDAESKALTTQETSEENLPVKSLSLDAEVKAQVVIKNETSQQVFITADSPKDMKDKVVEESGSSTTSSDSQAEEDRKKIVEETSTKTVAEKSVHFEKEEQSSSLPAKSPPPQYSSDSDSDSGPDSRPLSRASSRADSPPPRTKTPAPPREKIPTPPRERTPTPPREKAPKKVSPPPSPPPAVRVETTAEVHYGREDSASEGEGLHGGSDPDNVASTKPTTTVAASVLPASAPRAKEGSILSLLEASQTTLEVKGVTLSKAQVYEAAEFLEASSTIRFVNFVNCNIDDNDMQKLMEALRKSASTPVMLNLSLNPLTSASVPYILETLKAKPSLEALVLQGSRMGDSGVQQLVEGLLYNHAEMKELAESGSVKQELQELDLSDSKLGDKGALAVARLLNSDMDVDTLTLTHNHAISAHGWSLIGNALDRNETLQTLTLDHNFIGDDGLHYICTGLFNNHSLTALDLNDVAISQKGAESLNELLKRNTTLLEVTLTENKLTSDQIDNVQKYINLNKTVNAD